MEKQLYRADSRGFADHGWLKAKHTFSFAEYWDPARTRFGLLRVLNDDWIAPGAGFGTHPHDNMEIVTIPLKGSLRHKDSMGYSEVLTAGEVQRMSAGTGITHSEFNGSSTEELRLFQIWVYPREKNIEPSYEQKRFDPAARKNKIQYLVTPSRKEGSLGINQEAYFSIVSLDEGKEVAYELHNQKHGLFVMVIDGQVQCANESLESRDAIGATGLSQIAIKANRPSEVLLIEVPL